MHIIIRKIMHATKKNTQVLIGPVLKEERLKSIKSYKSLFRFCIAATVCVSPCVCLQCAKRK